MKTRLSSIGAILAVLAVGALAESPPAFVGTWKLNLAKSSYGTTAPPKSVVVKHEAVENGLRQVADGIDAEGKPFHTEFTAKFDGKEYAVTGGPAGDAIALKRIDAHTIEWTWRNGSKVVSAGKAVYSPDGKQRTLHFTAAKGEKANISAVYEKQ
jgi:hypothetical protein